MENRKLYLNNWEFNIARVLNRLEKVITDNDGYFISYYKDTFDNYTFESRYTGKVIKTHFRNYMTFVIDDTEIYFEIDHNPFFDFHYHKYPLSEKGFRHYGKNLNKNSWCFDCLFSADCNEDEIKEIANLLFNELMLSKNTSISTTRKRVYERNGSYHYTYEKDKNTSPFNKLMILK